METVSHRGHREHREDDEKSKVEIGVGTRFESVGTVVCVTEVRRASAGQEVRVAHCAPWHAEPSLEWFPVCWLLQTGWRIVEAENKGE
jgi:hypothetical protein